MAFNTHIVIKRSDVERYCNPQNKGALTSISNKIRRGREQDGRSSDHGYLVINQDEPYADEVIEIMKKHGHWG